MASKSDTYIQFILDELKSGNVEYVKVSSQFCTKFHKTQRTFASYWKKANEAFKKTQQVIETEKLKEYTTQQIECVKSKIKSKLERLEILQNQIDKCELELERDLEYDYPIIGGKVQKVSRGLTAAERARLRDTIQKLQSEISKIEGDYAATKQEIEAKIGIRNWKVQTK